MATATHKPPVSPREKQALILLAHGYTTVGAARAMGVRATTVIAYVQRARLKLGLPRKNRVQLAQEVLRRGWVDVDDWLETDDVGISAGRCDQCGAVRGAGCADARTEDADQDGLRVRDAGTGSS